MEGEGHQPDCTRWPVVAGGIGRDHPATQQSKGADKSRAELNDGVRERDEAKGEMERISLISIPRVSIGIR